jgi:cell division septal protein FtsQ
MGKAEIQRLLLVGVLPRLVIAVAMIVALWLGFFWATTTPGAL